MKKYHSNVLKTGAKKNVILSSFVFNAINIFNLWRFSCQSIICVYFWFIQYMTLNKENGETKIFSRFTLEWSSTLQLSTVTRPRGVGWFIPTERRIPMVFILDGCSFYSAHIWSKSGISIWWRHLVTSKEWSNPIFFRQPSYIQPWVFH